MKIILSVLLLALVSCANKPPVSDAKSEVVKSTETVRNVSNEDSPEGYVPKVSFGDQVTLRFENDLVIGIDQKRVIVQYHGGDGGQNSYTDQGEKIHMLDMDNYIDEDVARSIIVIDMKKKSNQARYIKKGTVLTFKLVRDNHVKKGEKLGKLNNLLASDKSSIERIILAGGALGNTIDDKEALQKVLRKYFTLIKHVPGNKNEIPVQVE